MTQCTPIHTQFCPAARFPFRMVRYKDKQQQKKKLELLIYFTEQLEISIKCVLVFLSLLLKFGIVYELNTSRTFCCVSYTVACLEETNMAVASMITCKKA